MTTDTVPAAGDGLPCFHPVQFRGDGEYRLRKGNGWLDCYVDAEWPDDTKGPSLAVWRNRAAAEAGIGPMLRITRAWFADLCIDTIGERAEVLS